MGSIALQRADVIVGVDTHKAEHVGFAIDGLGGDLSALPILAVPSGYAELLAWADSLGPVYAFGVEGTGSYGSGLAKFLRRHGRKVVEVSRPPRAGERRGNGKSDAIDAEHAARQVLSGKAVTTPKLADGVVEALRLLKIARDSAVKVHSQSIITLKAVLAPPPMISAQASSRSPITDSSWPALLSTRAATWPTRTWRCATPSVAWLGAGSRSTKRSRSTPLPSSGSPAPPPPSWLTPSVSGSTPPPRCSSPPATTTTGSGPKPPTPSSAASARSPPPPARPAADSA